MSWKAIIKISVLLAVICVSYTFVIIIGYYGDLHCASSNTRLLYADINIRVISYASNILACCIK